MSFWRPEYANMGGLGDPTARYPQGGTTTEEETVTNEELRDKMLAYIETQDGSYDDEWYASPRDFAATILTDFAEYLGVEIVVPEYIPQVKKAVIDRNELFKELLPGIRNLFDLEYKKRTEGAP